MRIECHCCAPPIAQAYGQTAKKRISWIQLYSIQFTFINENPIFIRTSKHMHSESFPFWLLHSHTHALWARLLFTRTKNQHMLKCTLCQHSAVMVATQPPPNIQQQQQQKEPEILNIYRTTRARLLNKAHIDEYKRYTHQNHIIIVKWKSATIIFSVNKLN